MHVSDQDLTRDELTALDRGMDVVHRMPHAAVENIIRHVLRVAIYYRRTRDPAVLEAAAKNLIGTIRRHRNPDDQLLTEELMAKIQHGRDRRVVDPDEVLEKLRR